MSDKTNEETKVVVMRFDNADFEKKINKTQKSVDKLDKSLCFANSKKDLDDFSKSLNDMADSNTVKSIDKLSNGIGKVAISLKNAVEIKLVGRAVDAIVDKTKNLLVTMTGINNIREGWDAYNESLVVTGGILNQVTRDGYKLNDVADAMDNLRWYADETSYSFQTMSDGIRQFTIAGIDLQKATNAVQGVANLAGSAKVFDAYKVQSGMDAISKAMQSGYMDTMKWTTLTNTAGIVTKDFSEKLLEAAAAEGTLIKSAAGQYRTKNGGVLVTAENIRDTLSKRWLTSDVLTNVLNEYSSATMQIKDFMTALDEGSDEAWKNVNKNFKMAGKSYTSLGQMIAEVQEHPDKFSESLVRMTKDMNEDNITTRQAAVLLKELGMEFDEVSYKAFISSQETTSFGQAISYVATAIKTTWQGTFQSIFGDVEQSTALWSDVSDKFYKIFVTPFEAIEQTFADWSILNEGGAKDFRDGILNIVDAIGNLRSAASEGFATIFDVDGVELLQKATTNFKKFSEAFKNNETLQTFIKSGATIFASALKVIGSVLSSAVKILGTLNPLVEYASKNLSKIADIVANLVAEGVNGLTELDGFNKLIGKLGEGIEWVANKLDEITNWLLENETLAAAWATIIDWINNAIDKMGEVLGKAGTELDKFKKKVSDTISGETTEKVAEQGEQAAEVAVETMSWTDAILAAIEEIKTTLSGSAIGQFVIELGTVIKDIATTVFTPLVDAAKNGDLKALALHAAGIVAAFVIIRGIIDFFRIIFQAKNILQAAADTLWAVERRIRKSTWVIIAKAIKDLAIAVAIIAAAIAVISGLSKNGVKIVDGAVTVGIILTVITGMAIGLTLAASKMRAGIGAAFMLLNLAIAFVGIAGAFIMVFTTLDKYKNTTTTFYVDQILKIMGALTLMISLVALVSKVNLNFGKFRVFNGSFLTIISTFFVIYELVQLMTSMFDMYKDLPEDQTDKVNTITDTITKLLRSVALILLAANMKFPQFNIGKDIKSINVNVQLALASVALVIWSIVDFCKMLQEVDMTKVEAGWEKISPVITKFAIFGAIIAGVVLAIDGIVQVTRQLSRIGDGLKGDDHARIETGGIGGVLLGLSAAVYVMIYAMRTVMNLAKEMSAMENPDEVMDKFGKIFNGILLLVGILGAVAVLMAALGNAEKTMSKVTKQKKGGFSFEREGAVKTPIIGILITIAAITAAVIASVKIVSSIDTDTFWGALQRIGVIAGLIAAFVIAIMVLTKIPTKTKGKTNGFWEIGLMLIGISSIFAAIALLFTSIKDVSVTNIEAITPLLITITAIIGAMAIAIVSVSSFAKTIGGGAKMAMISLIILAFSSVFAALALVLKNMTGVSKEKIKAMTPMMIAITAIISGMAIAMAAVLSALKGVGTSLKLGMAAVLVASFSLVILSLSAVIKASEEVSEDKLQKLSTFIITMVAIVGGISLALSILYAIPGVGTITGIFSAVVSFLVAVATWGVADALRSAATISIVLPTIIEAIQAFLEFVQNWKNIGIIQGAVFVQDMTKIGEGLANFFEALNPKVSNLDPRTIDILNGISGFLHEMNNMDADKIAENSGSLSGIIEGFVGDLTNDDIIHRLDYLNQSLSGVIDLLNGASSKELRSSMADFRHEMTMISEAVENMYKSYAGMKNFGSFRDLIAFNFDLTDMDIEGITGKLDRLAESLQSIADAIKTIGTYGANAAGLMNSLLGGSQNNKTQQLLAGMTNSQIMADNPRDALLKKNAADLIAPYLYQNNNVTLNTDGAFITTGTAEKAAENMAELMQTLNGGYISVPTK